MVEITLEKENAVLKFPKQLVSSAYVQEFLDRLRLETIVEKSQLSEEEAWKFSEEMKEQWWQKSGDKFLKGIKKQALYNYAYNIKKRPVSIFLLLWWPR